MISARCSNGTRSCHAACGPNVRKRRRHQAGPYAQRAGNKNALAEAKRIRSSMTEKEWKEAQKKLPYNFDKKAVDKILQSGGAATTP